jgi:hypothetical protein
MPKAPTPKEIRQAFTDYKSDWQHIQDEAKIDMRYVAGDPWDPADRAQREDAGRPCISLDELNQYLNQYNNNLRQNKRAVQLIPKGEGANDKDAARRESIVRGIENRSNAPSGAYIVAAENAASRSYGFALIRTEYDDDKSFNQQILIQPVLDPDTILLNPGYERPDAADLADGFVLKRIRKAEFKRKYPNADKVSFEPADMRGDKKPWIGDKDLQIAEYWMRHQVPRTLLLVKGPAGETIVWEDELKDGIRRDARGKIKKGPIEVLREREVMTPEVVQYLTNGLEVLDEVPWAGRRVPIVSCFGKEIWYDDGDGSKRHLLSMIRLARDAQMLLAYLSTQECEEAGMTPKAPFQGAKGQFESAREQWELINKQPIAFIEYDIVGEGLTTPIAPPARPQWEPNFQVYEIAKDSARRSIQSAMGITPLPTAAQRDSEKSGVALEKIDNQEAVGSFHFQDNFTNGFLYNMGWQLNDLIEPIFDTQREVPIENADGTHDTLHVVGVTSHPIDDDGAYDQPQLPQDVNGEHLHTGKGEFDVTISSGPSKESEREEQDEFVDSLIKNIANLPMPGTPQARVLALGIRMRPTLGTFGKQIADVFDPPSPDNLPPEAQAIVQQLQSQVQQLSQENQALHMERAAKVLEQQTKLAVEDKKGQHLMDAKTIDYITQIVKAELAAKSKADATQAQLDADKELQMLGFQQDRVKQAVDNQHDATVQHSDQAHEVALSGVQHERAKELADKAAQTGLVTQAADQAHQKSMAEQAQENQPEASQ